MNNKGMTIVEVLAAFAVLILAIAGFAVCMANANKLVDRAAEVREGVYTSALINAGSDYEAAMPTGGTAEYTFSFTGLGQFSVTVRGATSGGQNIFLPEG